MYEVHYLLITKLLYKLGLGIMTKLSQAVYARCWIADYGTV